MKTKILTMGLLMITAFCYSQLSLEVRAGGNFYYDEASTSEVAEHAAVGLAYEFDNWIKPRLVLSAGALKDNDTGYDTGYYGLDLDILFNLKSIAGRPYKFWRIYPLIGVGASHYEDQDVLTMNYGILNTFRLNNIVSLGLEVGGKDLYSLRTPIGFPNQPTNARGANGFTYYAGLSISINLTEAKEEKKEPRIIEKHFTKEIIEKPAIVNNYNCNDCVKEVPKKYTYHIFFSEGKTYIETGQVNTLKKAIQTIKDNPNYSVTINGYACGTHGSKKLNLKLSEKRAKSVELFLEEELKKEYTSTGYGVDQVHNHQHLNKNVTITIKK
ncbi:OmpA family protein [Aquimarina algiphila]|nr:OmpA family protein [Aquimarina algiphila]